MFVKNGAIKTFNKKTFSFLKKLNAQISEKKLDFLIFIVIFISD